VNKVISLWTYGDDLPSFRHRIRSLVPALERDGWRVDIVVVPPKRYYRRIIERLKTIKRSQVMILSKLKLNPLEMRILRRHGHKIIYDFDDAIYLRRLRALGQAPGTSWWREMKFRAMCKHADLVLAGNEVIGTKAAKANPAVEIVPTPVDAQAYRVTSPQDKSGKTIVWIGLPGNLVYLAMIRDACRRLLRRHPELVLRIVSAHAPDWDDVTIEFVPWSHANEAQALASADIGVMPLSDDAWSRGKCAFKLLQYMAAGLPCVASPVGANKTVITTGENGFHAGNAQEWQTALDTLLSSADLREQMGEKGRLLVEQHYDRPVVAAQVLAHIRALVD